VYAPLFSDARGDVYFAMGEFAAAASAYQEALDGGESAVINRPYIQVKLDSVPATASLPESELVEAALPEEETAASDAPEAGEP
jgi:hypothetical protein